MLKIKQEEKTNNKRRSEMEYKKVYTETTVELYLSIREFEIIRHAMQELHFNGDDCKEKSLSESLNRISGELRSERR